MKTPLQRLKLAKRKIRVNNTQHGKQKTAVISTAPEELTESVFTLGNRQPIFYMSSH